MCNGPKVWQLCFFFFCTRLKNCVCCCLFFIIKFSRSSREKKTKKKKKWNRLNSIWSKRLDSSIDTVKSYFTWLLASKRPFYRMFLKSRFLTQLLTLSTFSLYFHYTLNANEGALNTHMCILFSFCCCCCWFQDKMVLYNDLFV